MFTSVKYALLVLSKPRTNQLPHRIVRIAVTRTDCISIIGLVEPNIVRAMI